MTGGVEFYSHIIHMINVMGKIMNVLICGWPKIKHDQNPKE